MIRRETSWAIALVMLIAIGVISYFLYGAIHWHLKEITLKIIGVIMIMELIITLSCGYEHDWFAGMFLCVITVYLLAAEIIGVVMAGIFMAASAVNITLLIIQVGLTLIVGLACAWGVAHLISYGLTTLKNV